MPDPDLNQIKNIANCREMLEERLARSLEGSGLASQFEQLRDDSTVIRAFKLAVPDRIPDLEQYLDLFTSAINTEPKKTVQDPEVDQVKVPGVFRQVQTRPIRVNERGKSVWYLVQILREGFYQELDWPSAKLLEAFYADGNSQAIAPPGGSALDNTTTDNPSEVIMVRFPNLDPEKLQSIAQSVQTSCTNLTLEGQLFAGPFDKVVVHPQKSEDGSGFCDVLLAKSKYTLNLFARYNTSVAQSIGKMWNVPMKLAQSIVTAWKAGSGRSADANFRTGQHLVDLVLTATTGTENLTTDWIQISCDTWERYNLAWGYTEAEADQFITDHSQVIGTEVDGHAIMSRRIVKIDTRGMDGLFDLIIVERSYGPHADPVLPDVIFTLAVGTKIERLETWGYNLRTSEITSDAFKEAYSVAAEPTLAEIGKVYEIRITREDDCSFDYHAIVTSQSAAIDSSGATVQLVADQGATSIERHLRGAKQSEIDAVLATTDYKPTYKRDIAVDLVGRDDELSNVGISRRQLVESDLTGAGGTGIRGGARGMRKDLRVLHNAAPDTLNADAYPSARGARVSLEARLNDRGALSAVKIARQAVEQSLGEKAGSTPLAPHVTKPATSGDAAHKISHLVKIGDCDTDEEDIDLWAGKTGEKIVLRPTIDDSGAKSFEIQFVVAQNLVSGGVLATKLNLANLDPRFRRGGYQDTAYGFDGCTLAVVNALTSGYYFFEQLRFDSDDTWSGIIVYRNYNFSATGVIGTGDGSVEDVGQPQILSHGRDVYVIRAVYKVHYNISLSMSSALTHTPESPTVSAHKVISARPHKISFYGHEAWMGEIRVFHRYEWFNGTNWAEIDGVNMTSIGVLT